MIFVTALRDPLIAQERDRVNVAAVIIFGAVGGATVAVKQRRLRVGTQANIFDVADAGPRKRAAM